MATTAAAVAAAVVDLRLLGLGSKLKAYWDVRPEVSGAQASVTLSTTLDGNGTNPPTVTITGPLTSPRQVVATYSLGGALGTMKYVIVTGVAVFSGTSPGDGIVDIGDGNTVVFGAGTYNVDQTHWLQCTTLAELTGLANASLTDVLSTKGARYEVNGLNGIDPCLRFIRNPSALSNTSGVPALVTGLDVDFEIHTLGETVKHISGTGASIIWGFSLSTAGHTTKSFISSRTCGPTNSTHESRYLINRRDSSGAPATVEVVSDGNTYADLSPYVISDIITASGQMHRNGMPCRAAGAATLHRGQTTTLDRFSVGNINLSTAGFSTANQWLGRFSAMAITDPLTTAERLSIWKAFARAA